MDGQSVDEYVTELKSRSEHCEFGELKNSLIKDKIVLGVNSKKDKNVYFAKQSCR